MSILNSPFLTLEIIDGLLSSPTTTKTTGERINLLSAKLHLLTNGPSVSTPTSTLISRPNRAKQVYRRSNNDNTNTKASSTSSSSSHLIISPTSEPEETDHISAGNIHLRQPPTRKTMTLSLPILKTRLSLAKAYIDLGNLTLAEAELGIIEREISTFQKRLNKSRISVNESLGRVDSTFADDHMDSGEDRSQTVPLSEDIGVVGSTTGPDEKPRDGLVGKNKVEEKRGNIDIEGIDLKRVLSLRRETLECLISVEVGLGRNGRAERWRKTLSSLSDPSGAGGHG